MPDTGSETVTELTKFDAPFGREIRLQNVEHESGMKMMRLQIREGSRFTILDIDAPTAKIWGTAMRDWAESSSQMQK